MDDEREAYELAYALYLARQVDREAAQMIAQAAEALRSIVYADRPKPLNL